MVSRPIGIMNAEGLEGLGGGGADLDSDSDESDDALFEDAKDIFGSPKEDWSGPTAALPARL